jgi:arginyl-tRNA synthetase
VHPLHVGSLRGTVIGGTLARLFRSAGADVQVRYFVNDRGRQVTFLQRIASSVGWQAIPAHLRPDEAVGVLYAWANMRHADREADITRLVVRHPWLPDVVDVAAALPPEAATEDPGLVKTMVDCATEDMRLLGADIDTYDHESGPAGGSSSGGPGAGTPPPDHRRQRNLVPATPRWAGTPATPGRHLPVLHP